MPPSDSERIATLRQRCLDRKRAVALYDGIWRARCLGRSEGQPRAIRLGRLTRDLLTERPLALDDHELLLGRLAPPPAPALPEDQQAAQKALEAFGFPGGQTGHCEPDYPTVFAEGLDGLRRRIEKRRETANGSQQETLDSFQLALEGFSNLIARSGRLAEEATARAPGWRQAELREMTAVCQRIAHEPPSTFHDAIQLMWFVVFGIHIAGEAGLVVPGHMDRTLGPFYEKDRREGRLTKERALLLIESLYLLINETIPDGLAMTVMVGGRNSAGQDVTNELSFLCLEAVRRTRLVYPTVGTCWHEGTPEPLTSLAVELISKGYTTPAFFGDETIQRGLRSFGVPSAEANNYINSTCVEITPCAKSNVWVASPYFSTCGLLLEEIAAQAGNGSAAPDFETFLRRYEERLAGAIAAAVEDLNRCRRDRQQRGGKPLQSIFTQDCIGRARDIDNGGAIYNWVECSFVGLANLADSLRAIQAEVYEDRRLNLAELKRILDVDFAGHEDVRLRLLTGHPKYGNGDATVDRFVRRIVESARRECAKHRMEPDGSPFVPGAFCWIMHEALGRQCGATPDGRRKGFPFADGCGPAQGREQNGPTAAIRSTTSWDAAPLIGGAAFNMKFNRSLFNSPAAANRLRDLIVTFLRQGGFEVQVNVVDQKILLQAKANPEAYRDLVVRIGGYTDYFTRLSPEMQAEVLLRTAFEEI